MEGEMLGTQRKGDLREHSLGWGREKGPEQKLKAWLYRGTGTWTSETGRQQGRHGRGALFHFTRLFS